MSIDRYALLCTPVMKWILGTVSAHKVHWIFFYNPVDHILCPGELLSIAGRGGFFTAGRSGKKPSCSRLHVGG